MMKLRNLITGIGLLGMLGINTNACSPKQPHTRQESRYFDSSTEFSLFNRLVRSLQDKDTTQVSFLISSTLMDSLYQNARRNPDLLNRKKLEEQTDRRTADFIIYTCTREPSLYPKVLLENFNLLRYELSKVRIFQLNKWVKTRPVGSDTLVTILLGQLNEKTRIVEDVIGRTYSDDHVDITMIKEGKTWRLVPIHDDRGLGELKESTSDFTYSPSGELMAFKYRVFEYDLSKQRNVERLGGIYLSYSNGDSLISLQEALPKQLRAKSSFLAKLEGNPQFLSEKKQGGKTVYKLSYIRTVVDSQLVNGRIKKQLQDREVTVELTLPNSKP